MIEHVIHRGPGIIIVRASHDDALSDAPGLPEMTVAHDLIFQPVILRVDAAGEHQHSLRKFDVASVFALPVVLPTCHHAVFILQVAAIFPEFAESCVVHDLQRSGISLRIEVFQDHRLPGRPRADKAVQPK